MFGLTEAQLKSIKAIIACFKSDSKVEGATSVKQSTIKVNYLIAAIPIIWQIGSAFGINIHLTADQATSLFNLALFILPFANNLIFIVTSQWLSINPFAKLIKLPISK